MPRTGCRYTLFGVKYDKHVLRNVLRHLLPELYGRDPDGLRRCVQSVKWLVERNEGLSGAAFQVAPDLWAETTMVLPGKSPRGVLEPHRRNGCRPIGFRHQGLFDRVDWDRAG